MVDTENTAETSGVSPKDVDLEVDVDTAAAREAEYAAWSSENEKQLEANDDRRADIEKAAEEKEEAAKALYDPPEPKPDPEAQQRDVRAELEQRTAQARAKKAGQVSEVLQPAAEDYAARYASFQQRVQALAQTQDPAARQALEQSLRQEAVDLGQRADALRRGAQLTEQQRLHQLRPGLKSKATREAFVKHVTKLYGITEAQAKSVTDMSTVLREFDAWQSSLAEQREVKEAEAVKKAEKAKRKAERQRHESLPMHARAAEVKGRFDPTIALYGDAAAREAHRRAVQKRLD